MRPSRSAGRAAHYPARAGAGCHAARCRPAVAPCNLLAHAAATPDLAVTGDTQVNVLRGGAGGWAFGSAVLLAPHSDGAYPHGWLFLARHGATGWQVGFEGDAAFRDLSTSAPIVSARERTLFAELGAPGTGPAAR